MSSIYKKGRDGYFYYQAYVYNPETKKKDTRVFHALGTKNITEAKLKQKKLDAQYKKDRNQNINSSRITFNLKSKRVLLIALVLMILAILSNQIIILLNETETSKNIIITQNTKSEKIYEKQEIDSAATSALDSSKNIILSDKKLLKVIVPDHSVERVDRVSGVFEQGKLYVTVDKNSSEEGQRLLCKNLTDTYKEFSNIIICLYTDDHIGKNLANGKTEYISVKEKKQTWLAMYTYNSVEGAYFDNKPSEYLDTY